MAEKTIVVFVHGWSVRSTDTYGALPQRLGDVADVHHVWLSRYVSFRDEVRVEDLSRAFEAALRREIGTELAKGRRFAAITHSTGGPVVRDWWHRLYVARGRAADVPMSHLVMLAPANFGSALAQLGKGTLSRIKTWFQGVEPGTGVLDWLELGSPESMALNASWIDQSPSWKGAGKRPPVFPFVLTGQTIDRKLYDHVNSYTGESGSDGVVRVAAANLNSTLVRLRQEKPRSVGSKWEAPELVAESISRAPECALAVLPGRSHSGDEMGILRSVGTDAPHPTVDAVLRALAVRTPADYRRVAAEFAALTERTQRDERIEIVERFFILKDRPFVHDRHAQVIVRVADDAGRALEDFDFLMTAGKEGDPNHLPPGFFVDRQRNRRHKGTLTYYLDHDVMEGGKAVIRDGKVLREKSPGAKRLGFRIVPRPEEGFVHYLPCELSATEAVLEDLLRANETLVLDVVLRRVVREGAFTLTRDLEPRDFTEAPPGTPLE